jgi:hypothetical protein
MKFLSVENGLEDKAKRYTTVACSKLYESTMVVPISLDDTIHLHVAFVTYSITLLIKKYFSVAHIYSLATQKWALLHRVGILQIFPSHW